MTRAPRLNKRAPRIDLRRPAVLINSDGIEFQVTILDVSNGGFRLEVAESPRIGEMVTLRVERAEEYPAQIRWVLGSEAGGVFLALANYSDWADRRGVEVMKDTDHRQESDRRAASERREDEDRRAEKRGTDRRAVERRQGDRRSNDG